MQKQKPTFLLRESFRAPDEARRADRKSVV